MSPHRIENILYRKVFLYKIFSIPLRQQTLQYYMAISNKVGPPVTGEDFYGRSKELAHAHEYLDTNHSLVLSAPAAFHPNKEVVF